MFILSEKQLRRTVKEYVAYYNAVRPHQGIEQRIPDLLNEETSHPRGGDGASLVVTPFLNG